MSKLNSSSIGAFVNAGVSAMILRVFMSFFLFFGHGWGKLEMVFNGNFQFLDPVGLGPTITLIFAAFAEGICTILVFLGFYTRLAALFIIVNMAGAFLFVHLGNDPFGGMEMALMYLVSFVVIFLLGPGKFAVDSDSRTRV
ncbi:MAG: DoxX family protein [Balneolaceae bacterium]|nr:DoxX family protein [Balneolaceae bacterium]